MHEAANYEFHVYVLYYGIFKTNKYTYPIIVLGCVEPMIDILDICVNFTMLSAFLLCNMVRIITLCCIS